MAQTADVAARPLGMASSQYAAPLTITVTEKTGKGTEQALVDWVLTGIVRSVPKAIWGQPVSGPTPPLDADAPTINAVVGAALQARQDLPEDATPEMTIASVFGDRTLNAEPGPLAVTPGDAVAGTPPAASGTTFQDLAAIAADPARAARAALFGALEGLGVTGWSNDPLTVLAASPGAVFADAPLEGGAGVSSTSGTGGNGGAGGNGAGSQIGPGGIRLYDCYLPAVETADYTITVSQTVTPSDGTADETYEATQDFSVAGPTWSLPAADLFSVFPPPQSVGAFGQFLPHAVLAKPDLPWERDVFAGREPGVRLPWLAVLVFGEDDPGLVRGPVTITAQALFARQDPTLRWPDIEPEWYELEAVSDPSTACTVIDVAPEAFSAQLPAPDRLRWLAHARQVDATAKDTDTLRIAGDGWYSVVVAGRLPVGDRDRPRRNTAHLVSLQGHEAVVGTTPPGVTAVRLVSFCSWSFTCTAAGGQTFRQLMDGLTALPSTAFALSPQCRATPNRRPASPRASWAAATCRCGTRPGRESGRSAGTAGR